MVGIIAVLKKETQQISLKLRNILVGQGALDIRESVCGREKGHSGESVGTFQSGHCPDLERSFFFVRLVFSSKFQGKKYVGLLASVSL